jgi:hypothetical protein
MKPIILISAPNNGTDWICRTITDSERKLKYFREFFNPITNKKYTNELSCAFGCEYVSCYEKIAQYNKEECKSAYQKTWLKEQYDFTKENYSVFKIPFFAEQFRCFAMIRQIKNSFPPNRENEVLCWYDAIFNSMVLNVDNLPIKTSNKIRIAKKSISIKEKVIMSYIIYQEAMIDYCKEYEIPIIEWENLMGDESVLFKEVEKIEFIDSKRWIDSIIKTRIHKERNYDSFYSFDYNSLLNQSYL